MKSIENRLAKLEEATMPKRTIFISAVEDGGIPYEEYIAAHPECQGRRVIVIKTGIPRREGEY
ncbi:hypothetical protein [Solidesulfovibrio sp.]